MKLTRKQAFDYSIRRWEALLNGQDIPKEILSLELRSDCGLCEKYRLTSSPSLRFCAKCPIRPKVKEYNLLADFGCKQNIHPFNQWCKTSRSLEPAKKVLDLIKSKQ
jgi:hypothetical protein